MTHSYDSHRHHRHSIRRKDWDYGMPAYYFVTICTYKRLHLFDETQLYQAATHTWQQLPQHPKSQHIALDEWVVMPNHVHGIIVVRKRIELDEEWETDETLPFRNVPSGQLGRLIATYKMVTTKRINMIRDTVGGKVWQRGYWDRVIRDEKELFAIRRYIQDNPKRWAEDRENLDSLIQKMDRHSS